MRMTLMIFLLVVGKAAAQDNDSASALYSDFASQKASGVIPDPWKSSFIPITFSATGDRLDDPFAMATHTPNEVTINYGGTGAGRRFLYFVHLPADTPMVLVLFSHEPQFAMKKGELSYCGCFQRVHGTWKEKADALPDLDMNAIATSINSGAKFDTIQRERKSWGLGDTLIRLEPGVDPAGLQGQILVPDYARWSQTIKNLKARFSPAALDELKTMSTLDFQLVWDRTTGRFHLMAN